MLTILERMADERQGTYLLTDTDSMLFVASQKGDLVECTGGPHKMADGTPAVRAMTWNQVKEICHELNSLNPYDRSTVGQILKIEDCNKDRQGHQHQLYGFAISAKRYVVYTRHQSRRKIIKPSEHGLGMVYVPDERKRYKPVECEDQETTYPRWIVEAWERLLDDHLRMVKDPENALVAQDLWFGNIPAVMRIRVTTPNVLKALRKRDPGAAKPYNFALSPILAQARQHCTLVAPFSKHPKEWLTRDYTEIHTGDLVHLLGEYRGEKLLPQRLSAVLWRHYLHPEEKSLGPSNEHCDGSTRGLLSRRPLKAIIPFILIGKEVERSTQEGEDASMLERTGPIQYQAGSRAKTRPADPDLVRRASQFGPRLLMRESGVSQHSIERFLDYAPVHPATRVRLAEAVEKLERETTHTERESVGRYSLDNRTV